MEKWRSNQKAVHSEPNVLLCSGIYMKKKILCLKFKSEPDKVIIFFSI